MTTNDLDAMITMRRAGHSYRAIGTKFGMSHEKARKILLTSGADLPSNVHTYRRAERDKEVQALTEWLTEHGPATREQITETFGYSGKEINLLVQDGAPGHLILATGRAGASVPDETVMGSIQRAWETLQRVAPEARGLSHTAYDRVRDPAHDLSAARITTRYGWVNACNCAGVPSGGRLRSVGGYKHQFSADQIMSAVREYAEECRATEKRPTYLGYDQWQRSRAGAPSGSLVRMRGHEMGYEAWPEIVLAALQPIEK